ncbi:MAG: ABC transporter ATP-binding protein, partial [Syntrophobacterales bacterium]|jgi:iron complex transport system ATP-binding protein|nr:ABC transporter ATP-binding protein [Syntrophobacterales bacterium]
MSLLRIDNISFAYHDVPAIEEVSLTINEGDFWAFIGPNGSGKTTLLKLMNGILSPQKGRIYADEIPLQRMTRQQTAQFMAVVPQGFTPFFSFTVLDVVLMGRTPHLLHHWPFEKEKDMAVTEQAMKKTDILHLARRSMNQLSGGEVQRVLIARALAQIPRLLLLDEPTTFLDLRHQVEIMAMLQKLNKEEKVTIAAITHDINLASLYCTQMALFKNGRLQAMGKASHVITEKNMAEVYNTPVLVDRHPLSNCPRITPLITETGH